MQAILRSVTDRSKLAALNLEQMDALDALLAPVVSLEDTRLDNERRFEAMELVRSVASGETSSLRLGLHSDYAYRIESSNILYRYACGVARAVQECAKKPMADPKDVVNAYRTLARVFHHMNTILCEPQPLQYPFPFSYAPTTTDEATPMAT